jgi:hypothetical protein
VSVRAATAVVPRHWLARMLYRIALHAPALGYVETYGGFFYDDRAARDGVVRFGVHVPPASRDVHVATADAPALVEAMYRAAAPEGYAEL